MPVQYPWRTRIGWSVRGYMLAQRLVDVCESECLDVARGLWLTGADYISLYPSNLREECWRFSLNKHDVSRSNQPGGYSNS